MKNIIFVDGASCVGKTTICEKLFEIDTPCAYLDADWTRYINPYTRMTAEIRSIRVKTIALILRNYILYEDVNNIYFSWIMRGDKTLRCSIIKELHDLKFNVYSFLLTCNEQEHRRRMIKRNKEEEQQNSNIAFAQTFKIDNQIVIDVSDLSADQAAKIILRKIKEQKNKR